MVGTMSDITAQKALKAKNDERAFEELLREKRKWMAGVAYRNVGHFVTESDDEWSITLLAFHEAVRSYEENKGDFDAFAALVIRRRLTDFLRDQYRHMPEIPVEQAVLEGNPEELEDPGALELEIIGSEGIVARQEDTPGTTPLQDEIQAMQQVLAGYGFSFFDLADCSPKAEKTKAVCAKIIRALTDSPELMKKMRRAKTLPIQDLIKVLKVPRKILERHRKYIIASAEIIGGEYPLLADYLAYIRKGMEDP